jgi:hypothetical protein
VNLSISWCNLSPFKNSTKPSPSLLNMCSTKRFCLLPLLLLTSWLMGCEKPPHWTKLEHVQQPFHTSPLKDDVHVNQDEFISRKKPKCN